MKRPTRFKLIKDLVALSAGQLLSRVLGFVAFAYLARVLDPQAYGAVEYAAGLALIFGSVIEWGLGPVGAREVAHARPQAVPLAARIPTIRLGLALLTIPLMGVFAGLSGHDGEVQRLVWLFALAMIALPWKHDWLLQGLELMTAAALAQTIRMAAFALGVVLLVGGARDLAWVGLAELGAAGCAAAFYLLVQHRHGIPLRLATPAGALKVLLVSGLSIGLANMVWALIQYAPVVLLANLGTPSETGWFAASQRLVVALLTLSWVYHFNLYPTIARHAVAAPSELIRLLQASFRVVAWLGIAGALILALAAEPLIGAVFGDAFRPAAASFALIVWVLPITLLSGHARWGLIASGHQRDALVAHLAGAAAVLGAGVPLVHLYGARGAAIAALVACLVVAVVAHRYAWIRFGLPPMLAALLRPAAIALFAGFAVQPIEGTWLPPAAAAALCLLAAPLIDPKLAKDLHLLVTAKPDPSASEP